MTSEAGSARATIIASVVLVAVIGVVLAMVRPWDGDESAEAGVDVDSAALIEQLGDLSGALPDGGFGDLAGGTPGAREWAQNTWDNLDRLGVESVAFNYLRAGADRGDGSRQVDVTVAWESGPEVLDARFPAVTVGLIVRPDGDGYAIEGAAAIDEPLPVWLAGDLEVVTERATTLIAIDGGPGIAELPDRVVEAGDHVRDRLDVVDPSLVVVAPPDAVVAGEILGRADDDLSPIAALTTRLGGGSPGAEGSGVTAVVVIPATFGDMDERGGDIVLAHEAVHAMTDAIGRDLEPWVLEGFADYVALVDDDRSAGAIAEQYLERVDGAPAGFPGAEEFETANDHLGAAYEGAWLVLHYLAGRFGHDAVVEFHDAQLDGEPLETAFEEAFGRSLSAVEDDWTAHVADLAANGS